MSNYKFKTTNIKGKEYVEVNTRVKYFRESGNYNGYGIQTEFIHLDEKSCVVRATIINADGMVISSGVASEDKGSSYINKTSYVENCETSAVGRALGFLGIGIDTSIASSNEVQGAISKQSKPQVDSSIMQKAIEHISKSKDKDKAFKAVTSKYDFSATQLTKLENALKVL